MGKGRNNGKWKLKNEKWKISVSLMVFFPISRFPLSAVAGSIAIP